MRRTLPTVATAAMAAIALTIPGAASAATEVGDACVGDHAESSVNTVVPLASPSNPLPITVPQDGVVTAWKVNVVPYPGGISEKLKVLRPAAGPPNTFTAVGASRLEGVAGGSNTFETRIPVLAGDRIGAYSPMGAIYCAESATPADIMGSMEGELIGTADLTEKPSARPAVIAVIEPDADKDGFGDETQDHCPQSATFQDVCPSVTLDSLSLSGKGKATVLVATSTEAPVQVSGTVDLGKGKVAALTAAAQTVPAGTIARFTLTFTKVVKKRLAQLSNKQSLRLDVTASATNVAGQVSTDTSTIKLKGLKKPTRKK